MPDPENKTISATESAALFGVSPYLTKWMLWHKFASGKSISSTDDARKMWGRKMQPLIMEQVQSEMHLEATSNQEVYQRRGLIGCTRDAIINDPQRGPGALEIKCVFDYEVWSTQWQGGRFVPRHHEIQLQQQMYVGDGTDSFRWGVIVAWVCADLYYFERVPNVDLWMKIVGEAGDFFTSIKNRVEPGPFGSPIEIALLYEMYPTIADKVLDLSTDPKHVKSAEDVSMYKTYQETMRGAEYAREPLRAKLLALAKDNQKVLLPCGVSYKVIKAGKTGKKIDPFVPENPLPPPPGGDPFLAAC